MAIEEDVEAEADAVKVVVKEEEAAEVEADVVKAVVDVAAEVKEAVEAEVVQ